MNATEYLKKRSDYDGWLDGELERLEKIEISNEALLKLVDTINAAAKSKIHRAVCLGYWMAACEVSVMIEEDGWADVVKKWAGSTMAQVNSVLNDEQTTDDQSNLGM